MSRSYPPGNTIRSSNNGSRSRKRRRRRAACKMCASINHVAKKSLQEKEEEEEAAALNRSLAPFPSRMSRTLAVEQPIEHRSGTTRVRGGVCSAAAAGQPRARHADAGVGAGRAVPRRGARHYTTYMYSRHFGAGGILTFDLCPKY